VARNLDLTALRSFVTVADAGGVTRAAGLLNLTQSAVSMQLKRLEESLDVPLLDRSSRQIKMTSQDFEGEVSLGVPHDIIYPYIPPVLRRFAADFPRMQIKLVSAPTRKLREMFARGEVDVIITTEEQPGEGGEALVTLPLVWVGATGGTAYRQRPLPVAFCKSCNFRSGVLRRMDQVGFDWNMVVESELDNAVDAVVSADLAVHAVIKGFSSAQTEPVPRDSELPDPGKTQIVLYMQAKDDPVQDALHGMIRQSYMSQWMPENVQQRSA